MVREKYADQKTEEALFWRQLAEDSKATRIVEKGAYETALETANERLSKCRLALPEGSSVVLEVEPK